GNFRCAGSPRAGGKPGADRRAGGRLTGSRRHILADKQAKLGVGGKDVTLPVLEGSTGPDVVDIRKLYGETGMFTFDPGYTSTASCESALTYIDGEQGVLLHRGYPIGQLAEHSSFMEVSYLLLNGE